MATPLHRTRRLAFVAVAVAVALGGAAPARPATPAAPAPAAPGAVPEYRKRPLPDLEMTTMAGQVLRTRDLRGKVVLLDFWGTWCAPCRAAVPHLVALHRRLAAEPFVLISISNDLDPVVVERFVTSEGMHWHQVWDGAESRLIAALDIRSFPTYVLVDHEGNVVFAASGWGPNVEREIETRVASAVAAANAAAGKP